MKKLIARLVLFVAFLFIVVSCSGDDDNSVDTSLALIKKITETSYNNNQEHVVAYEFSYQGNVLKKVIQDDGSLTELSYNGNKITTIKGYKNNEQQTLTTFYYTGDILTFLLLDDQHDKVEYLYNDGILSKINIGYLSNGEFNIRSTQELTFDTSGNAIKSTDHLDLEGEMDLGEETTYTYDNKNNPARDINKYYRQISGILHFNGLNVNNIASESHTSLTSGAVSLFTYEYIYNADGFPTEMKKYDGEHQLQAVTNIEYQ